MDKEHNYTFSSDEQGSQNLEMTNQIEAEELEFVEMSELENNPEVVESLEHVEATDYIQFDEQQQTHEQIYNSVPMYDMRNKVQQYDEEQCSYNETQYAYNNEQYVYGEEKKMAKEQKKAKKRWVTCISTAVVFGIVASVAFQVSNTILGKHFGTQEKENEKIETIQVSSSDTQVSNSNIADITQSVMPSVVSITNLSVQQTQDFFWGVREEQQVESGSGIIIGQSDTELLIVTNNHVIEDSITLTVSFVDGESVEAFVKGKDANKDIAVVAVPLDSILDSTKAAIKVAVLGDSTKLRVGETTIAIGNALGYGQSVTTGIVSALNREIEDIDVSLIQTDAAINPGNSGGALLNANGEVIGINTAKVSGNAVEGMGYAIPVSEVSELINALMNRETRVEVQESERGYIGIYGTTFTAEMAELYNLPEGVFIKEIIAGGAAERAGLNVGNIITKIDDISVSSMEDLQEQLKYYRVGERVSLTVQKINEEGQYIEQVIEITLGRSI